MNTASRGSVVRRLPPAERERSIVEGAIALARESGLDALTVRAIAARVGVTPALVAHYRPVMDAFVAEVFAVIVAGERDEVMADHDPDVELRTTLLRLIESLLDSSRDDVAMVWAQSWALGVRNETLAERVREEMDLWHAALEDLIGRTARSEFGGAIDPGASAWMLLAMIDGMSAHTMVDWAPRDRPALARLALAAVLDAPMAQAHESGSDNAVEQ